MKKRKLLGTIGLFAALIFGSGPALAALAPYLDPIQLLEDNDWETIVTINNQGEAMVREIDSTTVIQVGDLFAGVIKVQATSTEVNIDNTNLQGTNPTFTGLFLIETASVTTAAGGNVTTVDGFNDTLTFKPASQASWNSVYGSGGLIDVSSVLDVADVNGGGTGVATGTMTFMFNGVVYDDADDTAADLQASALSFIDGGRLEYEFGYAGGAGEFWVTSDDDAALPAFSGGTTPENILALNITKQWNGPDLTPHNWRLNGLGDFRFTDDTQLQGQGQITGLAPGSPWGVRTDTDFWIAPVPEPTTLILFSLGLLGLGFASKRRKAA